ncbi:MAG: hypothetical protein WA821_23705 [Anaerolineales bacterium]
MEQPAKTNKLATTSFACGLLLAGLWISQPVFALPNVPYSVVTEALSVASPLTGLVALIQLGRKKGAERGHIFAWFGILVVLFFPVCQIFFVMAMSWSGY